MKGARLSVTVWLPVELLRDVDARARLLGLTRSAYVETVMRNELTPIAGFCSTCGGKGCAQCEAHGPKRGGRRGL